MLRLVCLLFIALLTFACASTPPSPASVNVEESPAADRWRVTIRHANRANAFVFSRTRKPFRSASWSIVEPAAGARWEIVDGHDAVVFERPTDTITLEFASDFTLLEKDYPVNVPFTDGSRLLYTGHLRTRRPGEQTIPPHRWTFRTTPQRTVRTVKSAYAAELAWMQRSSDETFVYFGGIVPEASERMTLVVDPGMPEWVESQMRALVPRQFDYFAGSMSAELPFKPLIIVSYGGGTGSGRTFSGQGLQEMLTIMISGAGWMPPSPAAEREWYRHLAHEVFHLWGGQAFRHSDEAEWLSEAASEYASVLASISAGIMDARSADRFIVNAANECAARLNATPLHASLGPGQSRNVYTCGVVSQKIVDAAARRAGSDIWAVWQETFKRPSPYTTADYLGVIGRTTDAATTAFIDELANTGLSGDTAERLAAQLRTAGLAVSVVEGRLRLEDPAGRPGASF